ncbi:hypothetical protein VNO77_04247 [Canavalia gladiata]|uniref:Uncharacterized protein n=1 Tax=Canavalia gladiata TaxID=3824 RepID=A0AAN9MW97_CANGL
MSVLRSKPTVSALIDELEKLRQPLSSALAQELHQHQQPQQNSPNDVVNDLLNLLYFGSLFDVKSRNDFTSTMLTRTHERGCCLTYDYVTDEATDLLSENDLDSIAVLAGSLVSRPADSSLSHKNALQRCLHHANLWLSRAQQPIHSDSDLNYAGLRERLNKIMTSEYFITTSEIKAPVEVAAAGNYASFPGSTLLDKRFDLMGQALFVFFQWELGGDEGTANLQGHGSGDDQSDPDMELQNDEIDAENGVEMGSCEQEQTKLPMDTGSNHKDVEVNKQQYYPRRGYQNLRGGRGDRGGGRGGYQNDHNQFHDKPANYYPRNNYYNNRGRGGGRSYFNHDSGDKINPVVGHIGVVES